MAERVGKLLEEFWPDVRVYDVLDISCRGGPESPGPFYCLVLRVEPSRNGGIMLRVRIGAKEDALWLAMPDKSTAQIRLVAERQDGSERYERRVVPHHELAAVLNAAFPGHGEWVVRPCKLNEPPEWFTAHTVDETGEWNCECDYNGVPRIDRAIIVYAAELRARVAKLEGALRKIVNLSAPTFDACPEIARDALENEG